MADLLGQQLGNYRLVRLLGHGGFGEVYLGHHLRLNKQAAIKVQHLHLADEDIEAFHTEAQIIASLDHPHIVQVLDYDVKDGVPFLVMDYAPNGSLRTRHPRGERLPLHLIVSYVKQIADALQYAHDQRLMHRDVKPDNMLLGRRGEVLLTDFGLATIAHHTSSQSTQVMAGTIPYMAPEQVQGKPRLASDQYALGIVVYEWLSGRRPFDGTATEIAMQHVLAPVPSLREQELMIPVEVEQVVLTALAKDPKQRFRTIQAFATALELASQPTPTHSAVVPLWNEPLPVTPPREPAQVTDEKRDTPPGQPPLSTHVITPLNQLAVSTEPATSPSRSGEASVGAVPSSSAKEVLVKEPLSLEFAQTEEKRAEPPSQPPLSTPVVNPPKQSAVLIEPATSPSHSGEPLIAAPSSPSKVLPPPQWREIDSEPPAVLQPSQPHLSRRTVVIGLAVLAVTGSGITWLEISHGQQGSSSSLSPTATVASTPTHTPTSSPTTPPHPKSALLTYRGHSGAVEAVAWSPDGTRIASVSYDGTAQVWYATTGTNIVTYRHHSDTVYGVAWSPDGTRIASGSNDGTVQIWDATSGSHILTYGNRTSHVNTVAWSPNGKYIAWGTGARDTGEGDHTVQVWDATTERQLSTYHGHTAPIYGVAWSPDSTRIASASGSGGYSQSGDYNVHVWEAATGNHIQTHSGNSVVTWSPDGMRIASAGLGNTVQVWEATSAKNLLTLNTPREVWCVAWSPNGKYIASGTGPEVNWAIVFDATNGGQVSSYIHNSIVFAVAWSPDSKHIASASDDNTVQVWQAV